MLALLAQLFAFQAAWGAPPRPPPPRPAMLSPQRAVAQALWYCRDRGFVCRPDGARLTRGGVWRVRVDMGRRRHRGEMVLDVDAWSGAVVGVHGRPWGRRSDDESWRRSRRDRD